MSKIKDMLYGLYFKYTIPTQYSSSQRNFSTDDEELTHEEEVEYTLDRVEKILSKQLDMITTIKKCVVFFTALTVISMVISFIAILSNM